MKAAGFWIFMFGLIGVFFYLTLSFNPSRPIPAAEVRSAPAPDENGRKRWNHAYAELYGPKGLENTWEIKTPGGYFTESDRDDFLKKTQDEKPFGEAQVRVKEDSGDLVIGIYYKGARP